jgi:hypothetical protein
MSFLRLGVLALVATATSLSTVSPARADEPSRAGLPHGISLGSDGHYYKDVCDHAFAYHCLARRRLPDTYSPFAVPLDSPPPPPPTPFAGGGAECTCNQMDPCGGGAASAPAGAMTPTDALTA